MDNHFRKMCYVGNILMLIALAFGLAETLYFGSNWQPESKAEFICDWITATLCGGGMAIYIYPIIIKTIEEINSHRRHF